MAKNTSNPIGFDKSLQSTGTKTVMQTLTVRPARIETADISTWSNAINSFKNGNRTSWFNLCENLLSDGVLGDAIEKLVEEVTGAEIAFQIDGKTVDVINDLIDTPEFEELMKEIALSKVYGRSVIECSFAPAFSVYSYPRKNCIIRNMLLPLSQRIKFIAAKEGDTSGYDYSKDEFIFEVGKDEDLGLIFRAAQYVIYKRGNFGDWAQFAEIFGMPFLLGKYNSTDTNARDQLFEALSQIGGKPVAAVPKESDVEVVQNSSTGSSALYKDLKDACNEEILIAIQGETMTTLAGSSRAQSKTHQDTNSKKGKALKRYVQRMLNKHLVPLLIKRGYPVVGGKFVFPKSATDITVTELVALSDIIDIPAEYAHNKYGIPMAKDGDKIAKKTQPSVPVVPDPTIPDPNNPKEPPIPPDPAVKKPKVIKLSDQEDDKRNFFLQLFDFFVDARTIGSRANLNAKSTNNTHIGIDLSDDYSINVNDLVNRAIKELYNDKSKRNELINRNLFEATYKPLVTSISKELAPINDNEFISQFRKNTAVFAAFKNHVQTKEMVNLLVDENGNLKPFYKFKKEALQLSQKYNVEWLKTEYNQAVRTARMAANLKLWENTLHLYPNLEYVESTASEKREEHIRYVGTILPFRHSWWVKHMPPSEWGCQCSVRPTDKKVTPVPDGDYNAPGFDNNAFDTYQFVDVQETPYYKHTETNLRDLVEKEAERITKSILYEKRQQALQMTKKLVDKIVVNKESGFKIEFTIKGLKEAINNPFSAYEEKLQAVGEIDKLLKSAKHDGSVINDKLVSKPHIVRYHYFETEIGGEPATLVVSEDKWGKKTFYSITEKRKTTE
jgi:hypothetical protein